MKTSTKPIRPKPIALPPVVPAVRARTSGWRDPRLWIGIAIVAVSVVTFACFSVSGLISRLLGEVGMAIVVRVLGLILCALAVQFIIVGLGEATNGFINLAASAPYGEGGH